MCDLGLRVSREIRVSLHLSCTSGFSCCYDNIPSQSNLKEKGLVWPRCDNDPSQWQELDAADDVAFSVRKQRDLCQDSVRAAVFINPGLKTGTRCVLGRSSCSVTPPWNDLTDRLGVPGYLDT